MRLLPWGLSVASDGEAELATIDHRLDEMRAEESRQWWHWYRWIG